MKKIIFSIDETETIICLYTIEKFGLGKIGALYGVSKTAIRTLMRDNNIPLDTPGRRYHGGKSAADKRYAQKHKKEIAEYNTNWQKENREHLRKYHRGWRNKNREHLRKYSRDWFNKKYQNDPMFRLVHNIRYGVWACLKESHIKKVQRTFQILPYTIEELKQHLETQFKDNMTWENYGEWHVDHKTPISSFNFTSVKDPEFLECWSLDNLQPLWGEENWSKGCKVI
jgi:hypothetical protein